MNKVICTSRLCDCRQRMAVQFDWGSRQYLVRPALAIVPGSLKSARLLMEQSLATDSLRTSTACLGHAKSSGGVCFAAIHRNQYCIFMTVQGLELENFQE
jgi:hypothetical protein